MSTSTKTPSESAEKADSQPLIVAVSEENLAALLRATIGFNDTKVHLLTEDAKAAAPEPASDDISSAALPEACASSPEIGPAKSPPIETVESRLALFAAVKEHRSAILRSRVNPAAPPLDLPPSGKVDATQGTAAQSGNVSAILRPEVAPLQVTPTAQPLMPVPASSIATPSKIDIGGYQSRDTSRNHLVLGSTIGVLIVIVGVSAFLTRAPSSKTPKVAVSAPKDSVPLQVQVEPLVSSKPPLAVKSIAPPQVTNLQSPAGKVESFPILSTNADALRPAKTIEAPPNHPPAPRAFTAPSSSGSHAGQVPAISFDQPPIIPSNTALPPTLGTSATLNNLPAPAVNQPPVTKQVRVGGSLQEASLIRKVAPHYPPFALSSHIEGAVRFKALIGKDGSVRNLEVISGNQVLRQAATDAVRQWIYRPTLLNGDPVEVITQIDVNFTLK